MTPDLKLALAAADVADRLTMTYFRRPALAVETKPDSTPVTEADRAVEAAVRKLIAIERPADSVLGEELGASGEASRRWVLDPIDGTANFVRGVPVWATLIGLEIDGTVQAGVVSSPPLHRRWWAERGQGAFAAAPGEVGQPIRVSRIANLSEATVSSGCMRDFPDAASFVALLQSAGRDRGFGDFWQHMLVAEGCCEVALDPAASLWDNAALQVIVEEAGGKFTDFSGRPRADGGSSISTNGLLHDEVVAMLSGGMPPQL
jgi:histidinol-phosphatase